MGASSKTFANRVAKQRAELVANYPHADLVVETIQACEVVKEDRTYFSYSSALKILQPLGVLSIQGQPLNLHSLKHAYETIMQELTPQIVYPLSTICTYPPLKERQRIAGIPFFDSDLDGKLDIQGYIKRTR